AVIVVPHIQVSNITNKTFIISDEQVRAWNLLDNYRKTDAQIALGAFGLFALYFNWRRQITTEQGHITGRFTNAVHQLVTSNEKEGANIEIRVGAVYALERIAKDSPATIGPSWRYLQPMFVKMRS